MKYYLKKCVGCTTNFKSKKSDFSTLGELGDPGACDACSESQA